MRISIIGSFKQFYSEILQTIELFKEAGFQINSPLGNEILEEGIDFVRFDTDDDSYSDEYVQSITLERLFTSDVVYVLCPGGYIGRTTCYEVGRLIQKKQNIYFSNRPDDLPIHVDDQFIIEPHEFANHFKNNPLKWLYSEGNTALMVVERSLASYEN